MYDNYHSNSCYFQLKIEENFDEYQPNSIPQPITGGIKMSIGFCRENFDLNKNAIIENKKKEYWVLDMFDGEIYTHSFP